MATVSIEIAQKIIAQDGYYSDDPRVLAVITYDNAWGYKSWAICYSASEIARYAPSEFVRNLETIWSAK